ncbi:MAG: DUF2238 domain-containing protein [Bacteroidetes bacterium]|nr:MAG: DUF2238 domain-containing protein [Bacteroidota bacterium]
MAYFFTKASNSLRIPFSSNPLLWVLVSSFLVVWMLTLFFTSDLNNWLLENLLTVVSLSFLSLTYKNYRFSDKSYLFIWLFLCLHVYGSQHTYAENSLGYWLQDLFGWERNHYDRIVHFSFGFLLAYPVYEVYTQWKKYPLSLARWMPVQLTLSVSSLYELLEWAVADIFFQEQGAAYLGTQGDVWDAQKDVFLALLGASISSLAIRYFSVSDRETQA